MANTLASPSLQIARLQHRQGDLHEARLSCEEAMTAAQNQADSDSWLEAARIFFQCCHELEELRDAQSVMDQVLQLHRHSTDEMEQALAENLIGSWLFANGKSQEAEAYLNSAIAKATHTQELEILARALLTLSMVKAFEPTSYGQCLLHLDKAEVILRELENPEFNLTASLLRAFIYTQTAQYDRSLDLLWKSYEQARIHGFPLMIPSILGQMARLHRDQGHEEQYKIYAELALRGIDKSRAPRLYKLIHALCPDGVKDSRPQFDFLIDEASRSVYERQKGLIDFKNQHILFDLALLFIKNSGQRYSKEDLVETIWRQSYDPELHDNLIYVSIKRLRTLIEPDLESPRYILRDRKGYYFNPQSPVQFKKAEEVTS